MFLFLVEIVLQDRKELFTLYCNKLTHIQNFKISRLLALKHVKFFHDKNYFSLKIFVAFASMLNGFEKIFNRFDVDLT